MTVQPPAMLYTQGFGSSPERVEIPVVTNVAPSSINTNFPIGKRWINTATNAEYTLTSVSTSGGVTTAAWQIAASPTGAVSTETGDSGTATPAAGNIKHAGTANQIVTSASGSTITYALTGPYTPATYTAHGVLLGEGTSSIVATSAGSAGQLLTSGGASADPTWTTATFPATAGSTGTILRSNGTNWVASTDTYPDTVAAGDLLLATASNVIGSLADVAVGQLLASGGVGVAPAYTGSPSVSGSLTAGTTITATLGDITATNGNLSLATAGNKIIIATGANASVGTSGAMSGTPGAVTVATTASSATAKIFYSRNVTGGTMGNVSITAQDGTGFTLTSDANETSTFNWWIINA